MSLSELGRYWRVSARIYPQRGGRAVANRLSYVARANKVSSQLNRLLDAPAESALGICVAGRPEVIGLVHAPFMNARWDARTRLDAFLRQFDCMAGLGTVFDFDVRHSIELPPVEALGPEYSIILDKPKWFQREGLLTLNIFRGNLRLFSLSFSIDAVETGLVVIIGAIQGRRIEGALDEYRQLTRLAHGIRPRDLLIEYVRILGAAAGAKRIIAVSDACRHHRHPFFGRNKHRQLPLDYDEIWRDRGGVEVEGGFFELPLERQQRPLEEVAAKKRAMYRQRYAMLDAIEEDLRQSLPTLEPVIRPEAD